MWLTTWVPNWLSVWADENRFFERVLLTPAGRLGGLRWRRRLRRAGQELSADCEAFLSGRLAERFGSGVTSVPAWTWTNLLAHGSEEDLQAELRRSAAPGLGERRWRRARTYLAGEVLREARSSGSLARLQREVLVPLELDLARSSEVVAWWPAQWVAAVERALHQPHRAKQQ
ncbi:MAG: hypothetical protein M0005_06865 [Actinomycetota bacterium]|jgi:hypothetical protein|nr:hypothetical protein [Actinomycetota bacterium]